VQALLEEAGEGCPGVVSFQDLNCTGTRRPARWWNSAPAIQRSGTLVRSGCCELYFIHLIISHSSTLHKNFTEYLEKSIELKL